MLLDAAFPAVELFTITKIPVRPLISLDDLWADGILVVEQGQIVDCGKDSELIRRCTGASGSCKMKGLARVSIINSKRPIRIAWKRR